MDYAQQVKLSLQSKGKKFSNYYSYYYHFHIKIIVCHLSSAILPKGCASAALFCLNNKCSVFNFSVGLTQS